MLVISVGGGSGTFRFDSYPVLRVITDRWPRVAKSCEDGMSPNATDGNESDRVACPFSATFLPHRFSKLGLSVEGDQGTTGEPASLPWDVPQGGLGSR